MKILFSTGHPAQIHNFRITKSILEEHGHEVVWVATQKDMSDSLLKYYNIEYVKLERPQKSFLSKIYVLFVNTWRTVNLIREMQVDFVVSRINPSVVLAAWMLRKQQII